MKITKSPIKWVDLSRLVERLKEAFFYFSSILNRTVRLAIKPVDIGLGHSE